MRAYLGADPARVKDQNKVRGELLQPVRNSAVALSHDIFFGESLVVYLDLDNKEATCLLPGVDYIPLLQDTIATDQANTPCYRNVVFLRDFSAVFVDYHAYGDLISSRFVTDVSSELSLHDKRLTQIELWAGANLYTAYRYGKSLDPKTPPEVALSSDNPGDAWWPSQPAVSSGEYLWFVSAVWRGSHRLETWSSPVCMSGTTGATGAAGANGQRTAIVSLYKWASVAPTGNWPAGTTTYTWATSAWTNPDTLDGWTRSPGSGAAGQTLYAIDLAVTDALTGATTSGTWSTSPTPYVVGVYGSTGATGAAGANGQRTAIVTLYKWASSAPTGTWPTGTSIYTWASAAWTDPGTLNNWTRSPGVGSAGQTLYAIDLAITDALTGATTSGTWSTSLTPYVVGVYGSTGATGAAGANGQRTAIVTLYKWASSAPTGTWPTGTSIYTWASAAWTDPGTLNNWTRSPGVGSAGQTLYAIDLAITDALTGATTSGTWSTSPTPRVVGAYGATGPTGATGATGAQGARAWKYLGLVTSLPTTGMVADDIVTLTTSIATGAGDAYLYKYSGLAWAVVASPSSDQISAAMGDIFDRANFNGATVTSMVIVRRLLVDLLSAVNVNVTGTIHATDGDFSGELKAAWGSLGPFTVGKRYPGYTFVATKAKSVVFTEMKAIYPNGSYSLRSSDSGFFFITAFVVTDASITLSLLNWVGGLMSSLVLTASSTGAFDMSMSTGEVYSQTLIKTSISPEAASRISLGSSGLNWFGAFLDKSGYPTRSGIYSMLITSSFGYILFTNGFCVQFGLISATNGVVTMVTFPFQFSSVFYTFLAFQDGADTGNASVVYRDTGHIKTVSATSFSAYGVGGVKTTLQVSWVAFGQWS